MPWLVWTAGSHTFRGPGAENLLLDMVQVLDFKFLGVVAVVFSFRVLNLCQFVMIPDFRSLTGLCPKDGFNHHHARGGGELRLTFCKQIQCVVAQSHGLG